MEQLEQLLHITYKRELELEKVIEKLHYSHNLWFFEETKATNIKLQIAVLEKIDKIKQQRNGYGLH